MRCNCYIEPGDDETNTATAAECFNCKEVYHKYCRAICRTCSERFCLFCFALMKHACHIQPRGSIFPHHEKLQEEIFRRRELERRENIDPGDTIVVTGPRRMCAETMAA